MVYLDEIKKELSEILGCSPKSFVYPPNSEMGDLSLLMFSKAKENGLNPVELAKTIAASFSGLDSIKDVRAVGPYLNFYLEPIDFITNSLNDITEQGVRFGTNDSGNDDGVMIEYSNGNTHKEVHIGHLRNISYGTAVYKILAANGYDAIPVSYINDFGIFTAKTLWNWQKKSRVCAV